MWLVVLVSLSVIVPLSIIQTPSSRVSTFIPPFTFDKKLNYFEDGRHQGSVVAEERISAARSSLKFLSSNLPRQRAFAVGGKSPDWRNITSSLRPSARGTSSLAFDSLDGYVVMFGGNYYSSSLGGDVFLNDTWTFDNGTWTNVTSNPSPPARGLAAMTYDYADKVILLYGGESSTSSYLSDTWEFSAGKWKQIFANSSPGNRASMSMAYDAQAGFVLLFGGYGNLGFLSDTWSFRAGVWTQLFPTSAPGARSAYGMTSDFRTGGVLLFGGRYSGGYFGDTWEFENGSWSQIIVAQGPAPRAYFQMAYDEAAGYPILFGGCNPCPMPTTSLNDTWIFLGGNWYNVTPALSPLARSGVSIAYDQASDYTIVFGGGPDPVVDYDDYWVNYGFPSFSINATPKTVDLGQRFTANVTNIVGGVAPYTFAWHESSPSLGCSFVNASGTSCIPNASSSSYSIWVNVTDSEGAEGSVSPIHIAVNPPIFGGRPIPALSVIDSGQHIALKSNISGGTPPYSILWKSGSSSSCSSDAYLSGGTGPVLNVSPVSSTYYCYVVSDNSSGQPKDTNASATSFITANSELVAGSVTPASPTILPSGSVSLIAHPSGGTSPYFLQWYQGSSSSCSSDNAVFGATTLTITVSPSSTTNYCYSVGDASQGLPTSLAFSATDLVTVTSNPTPPSITSFTISPSTVMVGTKVNVSVLESGGLYPLSFSYTGLPPGCASVNSSSFTCTPTLAGTYNVTATVKDAQGRSVSSTVTEVVKGAASTVAVSLTTSASIVLVGGSFALTAHPTGGVTPYYFLWSVNGTNVTTGPDAPMWAIHANAAGNYTYEVWVEDSQGNISHSNTVLVQVESTSSPPTGAHHNQSSVLPGPVIFGIPILIPIIIIAVVVGAALFLLTRRRKDTTPPPPAPVATGKSWAEESSSSGIAGPAIPPPPRVEPPDSSFPVKKSGK